jgi:hypothetical protein
MVLHVPTDMFLSNIDPVYPARAGPAASQNSPSSNAPTKTLIAPGDRGGCFVEGAALSRSFHETWSQISQVQDLIVALSLSAAKAT